MWNNKTSLWKKNAENKYKKVVPRAGGLLGPVAHGYLAAQYNPFAEITPRPCVPDVIGIPSEKRKAQIRGGFKASAGGCAFITVNPRMAVTGPDTGQVNSAWCAPVWYTNPPNGVNLSTIPQLDILGVNTTNVSGDASHGTTAYNTTPGYFDVGVTGVVLKDAATKSFFTHDHRCVGLGLRIKYIDTAELRSGTVVLYNAENNSGRGFSIGKSEANMLADSNLNKQVALSMDEHCIVWHPRKATDLNYLSQYSSNFTGTLTTFMPAVAEDTGGMVIAIFGTKPEAKFIFEVDAYYEFTGSLWQNKTASHCDLIGMSIVHSMLDEEIPDSTAAQQYDKKLKAVGGTTDKSTQKFRENDPAAPWNSGPSARGNMPGPGDPYGPGGSMRTELR